MEGKWITVVGKVRQDDRDDQILITVLEHNRLKSPMEKQSHIG